MKRGQPLAAVPELSGGPPEHLVKPFVPRLVLDAFVPKQPNLGRAIGHRDAVLFLACKPFSTGSIVVVDGSATIAA
ncbi:hypothetical protein MTR72_24315 [Bradyrhizobium sp. ISRA442]|uniref:hypothetical protein n=1 Tax=Bradyrhizobium sp. ISRA442 TaxID=2866197 RepID=UPI00311B42C3